MSGNNFFRVRVRVPIVFRSSAFPIGTRTRTRTRSCHVTQKLYFLNHAKITFPFSAIKLLLEILTQMAEGNAITLIPIHVELTTQEAANLLNVSRPFLIKLLEEGKIPFHKIGTHRRIRFIDLLHFKQHSNKISQKALDELVEQAQELDMGY